MTVDTFVYVVFISVVVWYVTKSIMIERVNTLKDQLAFAHHIIGELMPHNNIIEQDNADWWKKGTSQYGDD